jgi:tetratricopeptide (TPR) repeat protein
MGNPFAQKSATIVLLDPNSTRRQALFQGLKSLGFSNSTKIAKDCKELLRFLEVERVDWIISTFQSQPPVNTFHILKLITENVALKFTRLSLILDEKPERFLSMAFELGLMSYHCNVAMRENIDQEFRDLMRLMHQNYYNATLVAAEYLRLFLNKQRSYKALLEFEKRLLELFPGSSRNLVKLAEAEFVNSNNTAGERALRQAALIDPKQEKTVEFLLNKFAANDESFTDSLDTMDLEEGQLNCLGIETCLLVDPDTSVLNGIEQILKEAGVPDIVLFENGSDAWDWLKENPEPDLIIQEWRIPDLPGPLLLQRIRAHQYLTVPVVIISSLIKSGETALLKEIGLSAILEKPFDRETFFARIIWTLQQSVAPTEGKFLASKIRQNLKNQKIGEARRLASILANMSGTSQGVILEIEAEFEFANQNYEKAYRLAVAALKEKGDSLLLNNLLGKISLNLGNFKAAIEAFDLAQAASPQNIERLCDLALCHFESGETMMAERALDEAKQLDAKNILVLDTASKIAILADDPKSAMSLLDSMESINGVLSFMNNKAIALSRNNKFEEGVELYKRTIRCIPENKRTISNVVKYNLALAFARYGKIDESISELKALGDIKNGRIKKKIESLLVRLQKTKESGEKLNLYSKVVNKSENIDDLSQFRASRQIVKGDVCCFKVFRDVVFHPSEIMGLLKDPPQFRGRTDSLELVNLVKLKA